MSVHSKKLIERLEEYGYDCILYANICSEIDIYKAYLECPSEYGKSLFGLECQYSEVKGFVKKYSESARERRYNEHATRLFDGKIDKECILDTLRELSLRREIVRRRINQTDNALNVLSGREREVIFRCIINRREDEYMPHIAEELLYSVTYLYQLRDSALSKLERMLV